MRSALAILLLATIAFPLASAATYSYGGASGYHTVGQATVLWQGGFQECGNPEWTCGMAPACVTGAAALCQIPCAPACTITIRDALDGAKANANARAGLPLLPPASVQVCDHKPDGRNARCFPFATTIRYVSQTGVVDIFVVDGTAGTITVTTG